MRKRIALSKKQIEEFYEGQGVKACKQFGDFYGCWLNQHNDETADGECALCKRITDFAMEIGILAPLPKGGEDE